MDFSPTIWEQIYNAARRQRARAMGGNATAGGRYKRRGKVSKRPSPFKKVNTRAMVTRTKTKRLVRLIKGITLGQAETCYRTVKQQSFTLYHNTIATVINAWYPTMPAGQTMFPSQGNTDGNRKGDEILCTGMRFRCQLNVPYDRRNAQFKFFWISFNTAQGNPTLASDLLHNVTGTIMLDPIQTDRWKGIRYLGTYRPKSRDLRDTADHATILINKWIPFKRKVTFINDGSEVPSNLPEEGLIFAMPYAYTGALSTDIIAENCQATLTLYYKDP